MPENTYLELTLLKNLFSKYFTTVTKALGKSKTFRNFRIWKSNPSKYMKPFQLTSWQNFTITSVVIFRAKSLLIDLYSALMDIYFPFGINLPLFPSPKTRQFIE